MTVPTATDARLLLPSSPAVLSYSTMLGLAAQSSRWKHGMEEDLAHLAQSTAKAMAWQEAAGSDQAASEALTETSVAEQADGTLLESEGEALLTKGTADQAKAVAIEEEADGLVASAADTHGESVALGATAAAQEAVADEDLAKATADAALAAENTATAEADEAGTTICQFVPILDVICDVVGGVAAVGLETSSVRSAAMAAEEYATAAAMQAKVESATTEATELEASAVGEGEEAGVLQSKAAALEIQADKELAEGEADEAAATEELDKSVLDKEAAEEEQAKAATEEQESTNAWSQSVQHGANACGKAIMMSLASGVALVFWTLRIAGSVVVPVIKSGVGFLWTSFAISNPIEAINEETAILSSVSSRSATTDILHSASHILLHGLFCVAFFGVWGDPLLQLRNLSSIAATGGIVLGFSFSVAATQSFMMHATPRGFQHGGSLGSFAWVTFREFSRGVIVLSPLVVMEILLVWVNLGSWVFVPNIVQGTQRWWLWVVLALGIVVHHAYFSFAPSRSTQTHDPRRDDEGQSLLMPTLEEKYGFIDYGTRDVDTDVDTEFFDAEEDEWISLEAGDDTFHMALSKPQDELVSESDKWFHTLVLEDASRIRLILVFDFLMASVMLALLRQSTPALQELWPASKTILMAANPHWHLLAAASVVATLVVLTCACL